MSKYFKAFLAIFPVILLVLNNCSGQDIDASVTISAAAAEVNGRFTSPRVDRHFSILREFAGFSGLADRVSDVRLENSDGKTVAFKQFVPGEYVAESGFTAWHYRVDLSPAKRQQVSGHTSWLSTDVGLLFLRDVLPVLKKGSKGTVAVQLPNGWSSSKGVGRFAAWDIDATVVLIGKDLRPLTVAAAGMEIKIFLAGKWQFQDDQLAAFARSAPDETGRYSLCSLSAAIRSWRVGRRHQQQHRCNSFVRHAVSNAICSALTRTA
jgi:hypothetical protein